MSTLTTKRMLRAFEQIPPAPPAYFSGMFQAPRENFYDGEKVQIDIVRSDEDIAVAIQDISVDANMNSTDLYDNKEFIPPIYKEGFPINAFNVMKRQPGQNPFENPNYQANAMIEFARKLRKVEAMIQRAIELQAAQIFQTGVVTCTDAAAATRYTIDYKMKTTHKVTVTTSWATVATAAPLTDLKGICEVVRDDSGLDPDLCIMGIDAFMNAMATTSFKAAMDNRRIDMGTIVPLKQMGNGGQYRGTIDVGNYPLDVYTYNGKYMSAAGTQTRYLDKDNVIVMASDARFDATFGNIPRITAMDSRVMPFMPSRIRRVGRGGVDLITNAWCSANGEQIFGSVGARPLLIPTQIDAFAMLDTVQAA